MGVDVRSRRAAVDMTGTLGERLRSGDELALEDCYRQSGPLVRSYVRRFLPQDDVEDVVQQVFFELWRSRDKIDPLRSLEAFLLGIARNRSIDQLRKRRHVVVDVNELRGLAGEDGRKLIDRLAWASEVRRALATLPEAQRESIELAYFGDHTQTQIAERLGVPLGTVKARMARGMQRLSVELLAGDVEEGEQR
jgi:RNA polymerase sigma-70 factor (ECF subfamily)